MKVLKYLQYVWAAPVTVFGLLYVLLFWVCGWYKWSGVEGDALVWLLNVDKAPAWLLKLWGRFAGQAIGNVVVLKSTFADKPWLLIHEQKHVDQVMRLGVFQPIVYLTTYIAIKFGCPGSDPYYDNCMEIDARRAAGQVIDVEGAVKKIRAAVKK
jgi:hypothetical protein